jgi:hypothetical protein
LHHLADKRAIESRLVKNSDGPGSDNSSIHERALPKGAVPKIRRLIPTKTLNNGVADYNRIVELERIIRLPEFSRSSALIKEYSNATCQITTQANIILGNDFLIAVGINCINRNGANQTITWTTMSLINHATT